MSNFRTRGEVWIYDRLANDTTESDPEEVTIPLADQGIDGDRIFDTIGRGTGNYVVFQYQSGVDINGTGTIRVMGSLLFVVKVSGENVSKATLEPIADRVDHLIHGYAANTTDGYRVEARREQELALPPVMDGDVVTREIGGLYRLFVHRA